MNVSEYGSATAEALRSELVTQCDLLAAEYVILGGCQGDRERTYWRNYDRADPAESVSARDKAASSAAMADAIAIYESRASIESLKVKVALLRDLLA